MQTGCLLVVAAAASGGVQLGNFGVGASDFVEATGDRVFGWTFNAASSPLSGRVDRIPKVALFHSCDQIFVVATPREARGYVAFGGACPLFQGCHRIYELRRQLCTDVSPENEKQRRVSLRVHTTDRTLTSTPPPQSKHRSDPKSNSETFTRIPPHRTNLNRNHRHQHREP